jgi:hypothetical protein
MIVFNIKHYKLNGDVSRRTRIKLSNDENGDDTDNHTSNGMGRKLGSQCCNRQSISLFFKEGNITKVILSISKDLDM